MLAKVGDAPFSDPDWLFEIKYDGYRMVAIKDGRSVRLRYRSGLDATPLFPDIASAVRRLPFDSFVIDGEVTVLDAAGRPSFSALQKRGRLSNRHQIAVAAVQSPATYLGFDLLAFNGLDLRGLPLTDRKRALSEVLGSLGPLRYVDHVAGRGEAMFTHVADLGLEGVMAKKSTSRYVGGRSSSWLKLRADHTHQFAIVGFTAPKGARAGLGSLHVAYVKNGDLIYAGRVGSGIPDQAIDSLVKALLPTVTKDAQAENAPPTSAQDTWVVPTLACSVRYKEITPDGMLRQPVFVSYGPFELGGRARDRRR